MILWLCGPSGAGKSTLARALLRERDGLLLDGDAFRRCVTPGLGHTPEGCVANVTLAARVANLLEDELDHDVICAFVTPSYEAQASVDRTCAPRWVYVSAPIDELRRRDTKGLYHARTKFLAGETAPFHEPEQALYVDTTLSTISECVAMIREATGW